MYFVWSGKGENIWDSWGHEDNIVSGDTGDVTADSYHNYKGDVQMLKVLKVGIQMLTTANVKCQTLQTNYILMFWWMYSSTLLFCADNVNVFITYSVCTA